MKRDEKIAEAQKRFEKAVAAEADADIDFMRARVKALATPEYRAYLRAFEAWDAKTRERARIYEELIALGKQEP